MVYRKMIIDMNMTSFSHRLTYKHNIGRIKARHNNRIDTLFAKLEEQEVRDGKNLCSFADIGRKGKPIEEIPPLLNPKLNQTKALD